MKNHGSIKWFFWIRWIFLLDVDISFRGMLRDLSFLAICSMFTVESLTTTPDKFTAGKFSWTKDLKTGPVNRSRVPNNLTSTFFTSGGNSWALLRSVETWRAATRLVLEIKNILNFSFFETKHVLRLRPVWNGKKFKNKQLYNLQCKQWFNFKRLIRDIIIIGHHRDDLKQIILKSFLLLTFFFERTFRRNVATFLR